MSSQVPSRSSRSGLPRRPRLRRRIRYGAVHARLPHPPRGALERRRTGHRAGLRLHPPALRRHAAGGDESERIRSVLPIDQKTVRVVLRERVVDWRFLFPIVLPQPRACRRGPREGLAGRGSTTRRRGQPIGSGPFLVGSWERGKQLTLVRNPRYWGPHPAYLDRIVYRFLPPDDVADALRRGEIDMIHPAIAALAGPAPRAPTAARAGNQGRRQPRQRLRALRDPARPRRPSRAQEPARPAGARLRNRPRRDRTRDRSAHFERAAASCRRTASSSCRTAPTTSRTGGATATGRPERDSCSSRRAAAGDRTASSLRRRSALAPLRDGRGRREERAHGPLAQAQLRRVGVEVRPDLRVRRSCSRKSRAETSTFRSRRGSSDARTSGPAYIFGVPTGASNFTGYCDRLITPRPRPGHSHARRQPARRAPEQDRREAGEGRTRIPLFQIRGLFALNESSEESRLNGADSLTWNAEDWWLDR